MLRSQKQLGKILMDRGLITPEQLNEALKEQEKSKEFLGKILLKNKQIKEDDLLATLSEQFNIPLVSLKDKYIDWNFVKRFSSSLILDYRCFPVQEDEWSVTIAVTDPLDAWALDKAKQAAGGLRLKLLLVTQTDMDEVTKRYQQYIRGDIRRRLT